MKATPEHRAQLLRASQMKIGFAGYVRVLASLRDDGPMLSSDLAEQCGVSRLLVLKMMRHCRQRGVVHRCRWIRTKPKARMVPVWAYGDGRDISMPQYEEESRIKARFPRRAPSSLIMLTTILELLAENALTHAEIAAELAMGIESSYRLVGALREYRFVRIASWHRNPVGVTVPEFAVGSDRNARRPPTAAAERAYQAGRRKRLQQIAFMQTVAGPLNAGAD